MAVSTQTNTALNPRLDEGARQFRRVPLPDGKEALHAELRQVFFPVDLEVFQKDVPEGDGVNALAQSLFQQRAHAGFINGIG